MKGHSIAGRLGQIEPAAMGARHDALAAEMLRRGMSHASPYTQPDLSGYNLAGFTVDLEKSKLDLKERCDECRRRLEEMKL